LQAGLEVTDAAVIFDAIDRHRMAGQAEIAEDAGGIAPLEGEVVHGDYRRHVMRRTEMHVGHGKRRLPVMRMHEIRAEAAHLSFADIRADARQGCKALPIVGPVGSGRVAIRSARTVIEMRRIDDERSRPSMLVSSSAARPPNRAS
jgi:hypothetical protein